MHCRCCSKPQQLRWNTLTASSGAIFLVTRFQMNNKHFLEQAFDNLAEAVRLLQRFEKTKPILFKTKPDIESVKVLQS